MIISVVAMCSFAGVAATAFLLNRPAPASIAGAEAVPVAGRPGVAHVFLRIDNGAEPDRLLSAASPEAESISFAGRRSGRDSYAIPANSSPSLSADGLYLVATGVEGPLDEGRLIPISLEFERAGTAATRARVGPPTDPHAAHRAAGGSGVGGSNPPRLGLEVSPGAEGSWTVTVRTENFTFDQSTENPVHVPGHGHAHLYLDGLKLRRMYSGTASIGALPPGRHTIEVTLNTNTHSPFMNGGEPVVAHKVVEVR